MVLPIDMERAARVHAFGAPEGDLADIPADRRSGTIGAVALELGVRPSEVRTVLEIHWLETEGRAAARALGRGPDRRRAAPPSGGMDALQAQILGRERSGRPPRTAATVAAQFAGPRPTRVGVDRPFDYESHVARANRQLDDALPKAEPGAYLAVPLADLADDDPALDLRIYRGMGARDPAVAALEITGHLVPEGTSPAYERFKTYDNPVALDAYEWSLDPYVAAKGAGGSGVLASMTLRELKAQGAEVVRKTGDTEGGLFVAAVVAPEVRRVAHDGEAYALAARRAPTRDPKAHRAGQALRAQLEQHRSWRGLMAAKPKVGAAMRARIRDETRALIGHWIGRLEPLSAPTAARMQEKLRSVPRDDPGAELRSLESILRAVQLEVAYRQEAPLEKVWDLA